MKRNQPQPPTTHSTEKQREPYGQSAARAPSPEPLYAKVNKKPPRAKDRELNKPLTQQEEVVYAALDFENRSHHPRERYPERNLESETLYTTVASQSTTKAEILYADVIHTPLHSKHMRKEQTSETLYTTVAPRRTTSSLTREEIADRIQHNPLVQAYQQEVTHWCQIVYGNSSVLKEKMEDILQNPSEGEELSWQVAAYPQSVHKFAGVNVCGLKTSARRHAESGLSHLCDAVDNYANAVQQVKESITRSHQAQTRQNRQEQSVGVKQGLHKEKALSRPFQQPERQACHEGAKTSRQIYQQRPEIPPRKVGGAKAIAFAI